MTENKLTPAYHDGGGRPVYLTPPIYRHYQPELPNGDAGGWWECPNCGVGLHVEPIGGDEGPDTSYECEHCEYRWAD